MFNDRRTLNVLQNTPLRLEAKYIPYVGFKVSGRIRPSGRPSRGPLIWLNLGYAVIRLGIACLLIAASLFTFRSEGRKEKGSPFECGFDPSGIRRLPFCMKFFLVRIIFLVFDVEVTLVLPMLYAGAQVASFLAVLVGGVVYEWSYGGLH